MPAGKGCVFDRTGPMGTGGVNFGTGPTPGRDNPGGGRSTLIRYRIKLSPSGWAAGSALNRPGTGPGMQYGIPMGPAHGIPVRPESVGRLS